MSDGQPDPGRDAGGPPPLWSGGRALGRSNIGGAADVGGRPLSVVATLAIVGLVLVAVFVATTASMSGAEVGSTGGGSPADDADEAGRQILMVRTDGPAVETSGADEEAGPGSVVAEQPSVRPSQDWWRALFLQWFEQLLRDWQQPAPVDSPVTPEPETVDEGGVGDVWVPPAETSDESPRPAEEAVPEPPAPIDGDASVQQAILDATNAERIAAGCPALRLDPTLNGVADEHSEDMAARAYFDHTDLEGRGPGDRIDASGYPYRGWGENIASGYRTAEEVVAGWMNSPGHRRNILDCSFDELGVGYAVGPAQGPGSGPVWTQVFGIRR